MMIPWFCMENFWISTFSSQEIWRRRGEKELLKHYPDLEVDVLKAGQHGNKNH